MRRPRYQDLPITAKLLVPFLISMIVWGVLGTQVLLSGSSREASGLASTRLAVALEVARSAFANSSAGMLESARFAAHTVGVGDAAHARDTSTLAALLTRIASNTKHDGLQVVLASGEVLVTVGVSGSRPVSATGGRAHAPRVLAVARGASTSESTITISDGEVMAVVPLRNTAGSVVGAVVAFDHAVRVVSAMSSGTGVRMSLFAGDEAVASSGAPLSYRAVEREGLRTSAGTGRDRLESLYAPLTASGESIGVIGMGISLREAAPAGTTRAASLGLLVSLAVVLALAIGWKVARAVTVPVGNLVDATKSLEQGDLSRRAEIDSRDEIGRLASSFNTMAAELQASHEELERKVAERTAELSRVNAELARASEAKSSFLATMSHELRTPLNAVIGFADFLSDPAFGPPSVKDVRRISRDIKAGGTHLLTLINDLLDLAKIEAGKMEVDPRPISLRDVASDVEAVCRALADRKQIALSFRVPARLPQALADPGRLRQVLLNLIGNAIKFTPDAGTVTVSAVEDRAMLAISVADDGPGMSVEEAAVVFEPFERAAGTRTIEGAGLGLALARRFVEVMGGSISVESSPGRGSTFTVTVPIAHEQRRSEPVARPKRKSA